MKKVTVWLAILLCLTLISCSGQTDKIYKALDGIDVSAQYTSFHIMVPNLAAPSLYTEQYPEEYETVADFGKAGVPLVLDYVEEKELSVLNAAFFVCCCYGILEIDGWLTEEPLSNVQAHVAALRECVETGD